MRPLLPAARVLIILFMTAGCATAPPEDAGKGQPPPAPAAASPRPVLMLLDQEGRQWALLDEKNAATLLSVDVTKDPYRPVVPEGLARKGVRVIGDFTVCAGIDGAVGKVTVVNSSRNRDIDAHWMQTLRTWRYSPYLVDGGAKPFCTNARMEAVAP